MKDSIRQKLESVRDRFEELEGLLAEPDVIADQNQYRDLSKEYAHIGPIVRLFGDFEALGSDIAAAEEMAADIDKDVKEMGQEELQTLTVSRDALELELQKLLIPAPQSRQTTGRLVQYARLLFGLDEDDKL